MLSHGRATFKRDSLTKAATSEFPLLPWTFSFNSTLSSLRSVWLQLPGCHLKGPRSKMNASSLREWNDPIGFYLHFSGLNKKWMQLFVQINLWGCMRTINLIASNCIHIYKYIVISENCTQKYWWFHSLHWFALIVGIWKFNSVKYRFNSYTKL